MISKVKWKNHPILGNLELDFTDVNGKPFNTIILAGENGTGKTTILETLSDFLSLHSITPFDYIQYMIGSDVYQVFYEDGDNHPLGFHRRYSAKSGETKRISSNNNNNAKTIDDDIEDIRHYGVSYSKARSGFKTNVIKSSTTEQIDASKYNNDEKDDFTSVKQLLVDLSAQDNAEWMNITKNNLGISFEEFKKTSKLFRFENAFNNFFDSIKFKKIDETNASEKTVVFEKGSKDISVDSLSTGEKQIVFRGTQLLRNINSVKDGLVLIDEPELSMHPRWQEKILDYYRDLFVKDNSQLTQMLFATHSEYVIRKALQDRQNVLIVVLKEENGIITSEKVTAPSVLPSITAAETNYLAFNIISTDYHIQLYGYLQSLTQNLKVKDCDTYIKNHRLFDQSKHGKISGFNSAQYETLCTYIRNAIDHPDSGNVFSKDELKISIELLIEMCKNL